MVKKITFFVFVIACNFQNIFGQFVVGASEVDNAAQFEVVSTNKGVLLPRVQLTGTNDVTTVSNVSIGSKESLLVYNTATANDVIPGYYYWDKNKWVPLSGADNQTLSLSGTDLSIQDGNTISLSGLLDDLGNHTATKTLDMSGQNIVDGNVITAGATSEGRSSIRQGGANNTGYFEIRKADDTRLGYIGYNNTNFQYNSENGADHYFSGGNIQIRNTKGSNIINVLSGGDGIGWGNRGNDYGINFQTASSVQSGNLARISAGDVSSASNTGNRYLGFQVGRNKQNSDTKLLYLLGQSNGTQRVGVLNENPSATLDVNGNARIRSIATGTTNDEVLTVDANGNIRKVTVEEVSSKGDTDDQTLSFTGTTLSISEGNNVNLNSLKDNLGNHNASTRLWMNGNEIQGAGSNTLINGVEVGQVGHGGSWLGLANRNQATTSGYALIQNNSGQTLLNTQNGQKIGFRVANAEKMTMTSSGNFGIGVVSPSAKLDVNGNTRIRSIAGGATSDQVLTVDGIGNVRKVSMSTVAGQGGTDGDAWGVNGEDRTSSISRTGNVGIGGAPSFKLHVRGRAKLDGSDAGTWIESGANDWFFGRNNADLRLYNNGDKVTFKPNGDVGIGTSNPQSKLTVVGNGRIKADQPNLFFDRDGKVVWRLYVDNNLGGTDTNDFVIRKQGAGTPFMVFNDVNQNICIGGNNSNPRYKLIVEGEVKATSFRSDTQSYPDYVFDHYYDGESDLNKKYEFPSLEEVEKFTKKNHHLPGVTPYSGVKEGIDLTEISVQNLEKVEELYLHIIELNKTIKSLKKENKDLNKKLNSEMTLMNERIEQLSKLVKKSSK